MIDPMASTSGYLLVKSCMLGDCHHHQPRGEPLGRKGGERLKMYKTCVKEMKEDDDD